MQQLCQLRNGDRDEGEAQGHQEFHGTDGGEAEEPAKGGDKENAEGQHDGPEQRAPKPEVLILELEQGFCQAAGAESAEHLCEVAGQEGHGHAVRTGGKGPASIFEPFPEEERENDQSAHEDTLHQDDDAAAIGE